MEGVFLMCLPMHKTTKNHGPQGVTLVEVGSHGGCGGEGGMGLEETFKATTFVTQKRGVHLVQLGNGEA